MRELDEKARFTPESDLQPLEAESETAMAEHVQPVIPEPEALKQGSVAEIKAVAEPVTLAPLPVAPCRKQYAELVHNRRKVDNKPMSYKQFRYLHALTGINFNKYLKRARLSTKRASLLIGYCLKKAA